MPLICIQNKEAVGGSPPRLFLIIGFYFLNVKTKGQKKMLGKEKRMERFAKMVYQNSSVGDAL